ncbi:hypothetical protein BDR26DRAFT_852513 [Obelidium mucronatum]|nr:hypothetical protein BDR26DRAFT_852513 [Obelidium mucronatum]
MRLLWNTRRKGEPRGTRYFSYPSSSATLYRPTSDDNPNASFTASELVDMCHNADSVHGHALSITRKWKSVQLQKLETCKTQSLFVHGEFPLLHILNRTTEASQMMKQAWMPNLEQIDWKQQWIFEKVDLVLCKTRITCTAIDKYLAASEVIDKGLEKRTKQDFNKFFHSYGASKRKHTLELVECWKRHPEWPVLTITVFGKKRPNNLRIYRNLPIDRHRQLQFEHGRALSALVITTDYPPMNEFVTDGESGAGAFDHQMIAPYFPPEAAVSSEKICLAVERVMSLDLESRRRNG